MYVGQYWLLGKQVVKVGREILERLGKNQGEASVWISVKEDGDPPGGR